MILYNFAEMMTSHVVISQMDKRHPYQVNFTVAVHVVDTSCAQGTMNPRPMLSTDPQKHFAESARSPRAAEYAQNPLEISG